MTSQGELFMKPNKKIIVFSIFCQAKKAHRFF